MPISIFPEDAQSCFEICINQGLLLTWGGLGATGKTALFYLWIYTSQSWVHTKENMEVSWFGSNFLFVLQM